MFFVLVLFGDFIILKYGVSAGDTVPVFVNYGDVGSSTNYKFKTYNDAFAEESVVECEGSSGYAFVALLRTMLILKD